MCVYRCNIRGLELSEPLSSTVFKTAVIDREERITTYRGNERIDEIRKKYELVGIHTGRRTFIVNALSHGIAPSVVMKWTGHASYNSMKPYIDIVDTIKASEMSKMNFVD